MHSNPLSVTALAIVFGVTLLALNRTKASPALRSILADSTPSSFVSADCTEAAQAAQVMPDTLSVQVADGRSATSDSLGSDEVVGVGARALS